MGEYATLATTHPLIPNLQLGRKRHCVPAQEAAVSDEPKPDRVLTGANALVHEEIDEALLDVLEGITALDDDAAEAAWDRFVLALQAHTRFEEAEIFTRYASLGPHPRGEGLELFEADHISLDKVVRAGVNALAAIRAAETHKRRVMIAHLGPLLRVRNVLEHHTLREERLLYPTLEASLRDEAAETLSAALKAARPSDR